MMSQFKDVFGDLSPIIQGLVVSSILLPAALASIVAGSLADRISRTRTFAIGGAIFAVGVVLECASKNLAMLIVGRCISGVGEGLFLSVVTVYLCEIAPTAIRGRMLCTLQLYIVTGVALGENRSGPFFPVKIIDLSISRLLRLLWFSPSSKLVCLALSVHGPSHSGFNLHSRRLLPSALP